MKHQYYSWPYNPDSVPLRLNTQFKRVGHTGISLNGIEYILSSIFNVALGHCLKCCTSKSPHSGLTLENAGKSSSEDTGYWFPESQSISQETLEVMEPTHSKISHIMLPSLFLFTLPKLNLPSSNIRATYRNSEGKIFSTECTSVLLWPEVWRAGSFWKVSK